jgi:hypothetical protein
LFVVCIIKYGKIKASVDDRRRRRRRRRDLVIY